MKKNILCIDDIMTNLLTLQAVIESANDYEYNVLLAQSAKEGVSILEKEEIDIILLDIVMPDIDGFECAKIIKSNQKTKDIPIIFVTAQHDDETIKKCYSIGGEDYVNKPFNHVELLARISFHLNLKEKDRLLKEEKEYTQNILDLQENLILVTDGTTELNVNRALLDFYGFDSLDAFHNENRGICYTFVHDEDYFYMKNSDDETKWVERIIEMSAAEDVLVKILKKNREYIFNLKATHFKDHYIVTFTDITQIKRESLEYRYEANYDSLTKVYNRNMFHKLMDKKIDSPRTYQEKFVFIILDIDYFKQVNDTYGHLVGDSVLISLSSLIKSKIRDIDIFARWGGEEFVLSFDVDLEQGVVLAENLRKSIQEYHFETVGELTCSFGITEYTKKDTLDALIIRADEALYKAKKTGRNRVCIN